MAHACKHSSESGQHRVLWGRPNVRETNYMNSKHPQPVTHSRHFKTIDIDFPHVARSITLFWGHAELVSYLRNLQSVSDDRVRAGFPSDVLFAIDQLAALHDQTFPDLVHVDRDFWDTF